MLRTVEIVQGQPVPDCTHLTAEQANERKAEVQKRLGIIRKDPAFGAERAVLIQENFALERHLRELREAKQREHTRRTFAGIGSPLHEALVELRPELVAELERLALRKLAEREQRAAARRAAKASA